MKSGVELSNAAAIVEALGLVPHPKEGGYFRETYRAAEALPAVALGGRYATRFSISTPATRWCSSGSIPAGAGRL